MVAGALRGKTSSLQTAGVWPRAEPLSLKSGTPSRLSSDLLSAPGTTHLAGLISRVSRYLLGLGGGGQKSIRRGGGC